MLPPEVAIPNKAFDLWFCRSKIMVRRGKIVIIRGLFL